MVAQMSSIYMYITALEVEFLCRLSVRIVSPINLNYISIERIS